MKFVEVSLLSLSLLLANTASASASAATATATVGRSIRKRGTSTNSNNRRLKGSSKKAASSSNDEELVEQASTREAPDSQDDHHEGHKHGPRYAKAPKSRDCKWKTKDDKVEFECKSKSSKSSSDENDNSRIRDQLKYKIGAKGEKSLKINVEYKQHVDDSETEDAHTDTKTKYEIVFDRIVEYRKPSNNNNDNDNEEEDPSDTTAPIQLSRSGSLNNDTSVAILDIEDPEGDDIEDLNAQAYDWDADEIVQEWTMEDWNDFSNVEVDPQGNLNTFSVSSKDEIVKFYFTIAQTDTNDITANRMKIDFELTNFPWMATDSYVALLCNIDSTRTIKVEYDNEQDNSMDDPEAVLAKAPKGKTRKTTEVLIDFEEGATAATTTQGDFSFVPFGEYTWKETAEVRSVNGTAEDSMSTVDVDVDIEQDDIDDPTNSNSTRDESSSPNENDDEPSSQTIQVIATSLENTNRIAFSFVGAAARSAKDIFWDPEAGVGFEDNSGGFGITRFSFLTMAGSIFVAAAFASW